MMRIGCLQFAPKLGDVDNNLNRADAVLSKANPDDLDLLVLPQLAFSGYNFRSLQEISPFLEPSRSGITSLWARTIALRYNCVVLVGYPEKVDVSPNWPTGPEYYSSAIVVNGDGETIANYRQSHLYSIDETWALEGNAGFYNGFIPGLGHTSIGICMDINPYRFEAPWNAFEFAFDVLQVKSNLVIVSMAWMTREDRRGFSRTPNEPDMQTLEYWIERLEPIIRSNNQEEVIVVFCNRTGFEEDATYAGTSAIVGIQDGEVNVYGMLGRGEKELLVVDTEEAPFAKLVYRPNGGRWEEIPADVRKQEANLALATVTNSSHGSNPAKGDIEDRKSSNDVRCKHFRSASRTSRERSIAPSPSDRNSPGLNSVQSSLGPHPKVATKTEAKKKKRQRQTPSITIPAPSDQAFRKGADMDIHGIPTPSGPSPIPLSLRPRLIIPQSNAASQTISTSSIRSSDLASAVQFKMSNVSGASTQAISSTSRPPEDSTPYPHSGMFFNGYPTRSWQPQKCIYGGNVTITHAPKKASQSPLPEPNQTSPPLIMASSTRKTESSAWSNSHDGHGLHQSRPASPKSRNASRSRARSRSDSAVSQINDTTATGRHQERTTSVLKGKGRVRSRSRSHSRVQSRQGREGQQTIPIAASPSLLGGTFSRPVIPTPVAMDYYLEASTKKFESRTNQPHFESVEMVSRRECPVHGRHSTGS